MKSNRNKRRLYRKSEFCTAVSCSWLHPNGKTCADTEGNCAFTAKEFHHWLKSNNFRIVKDEKNCNKGKQKEEVRSKGQKDNDLHKAKES